MTLDLELAPIAAGTADADDARKLLRALPSTLSSEEAAKLVDVFRAWVWKALNYRRRDQELRDWHDILKRVQARLRHSEGAAAQIKLIADLVYESVAVSERRASERPLERRHAKELLTLLRDAPEQQLSKRVLMAKLRIKDANLWRLANILIEADLVTRTNHGREAVYTLTHEGLREINRQDGKRSAESDPAEACFQLILHSIDHELLFGGRGFSSKHFISKHSILNLTHPTVIEDHSEVLSNNILTMPENRVSKSGFKELDAGPAIWTSREERDHAYN